MKTITVGCLKVFSYIYAISILGAEMLTNPKTRRLFQPEGCGIQERALVVTAWSLADKPSQRKELRLLSLIRNGAPPSVCGWLPFRMAACAGCLQTLSRLCSMERPSEHAMADALEWATVNKHIAVCEYIRSLGK